MGDDNPRFEGDSNCRHEYYYSKKNRYRCFRCSRRVKERPSNYTAEEEKRDHVTWEKYGRFVGQRHRWWPYDLFDPRKGGSETR